MIWNVPIWVYLWLAGMAGGAYFTAFLAERFGGQVNRQLLRLATYIGIPLAVVGVLLLVVDLGHPVRFWHLLARFEVISPMSLGVWILLVWVAIAVIMVILWWAEQRAGEPAARSLRRVIEPLAWIDFAVAILLMAYTGVLLANSNQPLLSTGVLLPSLFVASAVSTGVALLVLASLTINALNRRGSLKSLVSNLFGSADWAISSKMIGRLAEADAVVIVIELAVMIGYAVWLGVSTLAGTGEALRLLTTGVMAAPFWAGVVVLALLIPLGLELVNWGREIETRAVWRATIASSASVILGGIVLRAVMVIGGQL